MLSLCNRDVVNSVNMPDFTMAWTDGNLEGERILKIGGPFTLSSVFDFQDAIRSNHPPMTVIDLSEVPYMDSSALGSLMGLHVSCQKDGRQYGLIGVSERLQTLFRVAGVNSILTIFGSLDEAETAFSGRAAKA